jgi:membrane protease YdiL (CAAX protease family)
MLEREKTVAAALFVVTALTFPILFRTGSEGQNSGPRMARFMVRSALLELKLETAMEIYSPAAEDGAPTDDQGEALEFFAPQTWLDATVDMAAETRKAVLTQIAVSCLAVGRDQDAQILITKGRFDIASEDPFGYLLLSVEPPEPDRLSKDLEASTLPGWASALVLDRYGADRSGQPPSKEVLMEALAPWTERTTLFFGAILICFLAGLVLLAVLPRILARYRRPESVLERGMFGAPPLYTYLIFASWFALSTTLSMLLVPLLKESLTEAQIILVAYLVSGGIGLFLVVKRGMMRTPHLPIAVDLDRASASVRNMAFGVAGYVVAVPVVAFLTIFSTVVLGGGEDGLNPAIPVLVESHLGLDFWLLVANVVILAPLFEEFFFRGFLFQQFRRFYSLPNAVLLSAAVFAAVHLSIESFLPLFGLGVLLAGVYHTTRSLWAAMITHALWNLGTVMAVTVLFGS